jgi:hypothetical protein
VTTERGSADPTADPTPGGAFVRATVGVAARAMTGGMTGGVRSGTAGVLKGGMTVGMDRAARSAATDPAGGALVRHPANPVVGVARRRGIQASPAVDDASPMSAVAARG